MSRMCRVCSDERKQKPSFISQLSSVTRTERTVGRQRANNSVDQAPSKACGKVPSCPIPRNSSTHPDFNLHLALISKTESLMWEEWREGGERGRKKGNNWEYGFQSCVIFFMKYSSLEIKQCGAFYVLRPQWMKELRFPAAACSVSSEDLKNSFFLVSVYLSFIPSLQFSPSSCWKSVWTSLWFSGRCSSL